MAVKTYKDYQLQSALKKLVKVEAPCARLNEALIWYAENSFMSVLTTEADPITIEYEGMSVIGDVVNATPRNRLISLLSQIPNSLSVCVDVMTPLQDGIFICKLIPEGDTSGNEIVSKFVGRMGPRREYYTNTIGKTNDIVIAANVRSFIL
jgi:hypothetical protein